MIKSALEYLHGLARPAIVEAYGRQYSSCQLHPVATPKPDPLKLTTLSGLIDYIESRIDGIKPCMIHVEDPETVRLLTGIVDHWMARRCLAVATYQGTAFRFGQFMSQEEFIIGVNSLFQETEDRNQMLDLVSRLTKASSRNLDDNGMTQTVVTKNTLTTVGEKEVRSRVILRPYRTFTEVGEQPASEFLCRLRPGRDDELPTVALFEADGGAWKSEAIAQVAVWIKGALGEEDQDISVIA
jgi:hypothetical protein